jgi:hypothetical protein
MFYLRESEASAAKRPAGTEINPTFCRRVLLYLYDTLVLLKLSFSTKESPINLEFIGLLWVVIGDMEESLKLSRIHNPALANKQVRHQDRRQSIDEYHALKRWHYCVNYF